MGVVVWLPCGFGVSAWVGGVWVSLDFGFLMGIVGLCLDLVCLIIWDG